MPSTVPAPDLVEATLCIPMLVDPRIATTTCERLLMQSTAKSTALVGPA